jgi:hypothetical protein
MTTDDNITTIIFENLPLLSRTVSIDKLMEHLDKGDIIVARFMTSNIADLCFKHKDDSYPSMACGLSGCPDASFPHDTVGIKSTLKSWKQMSFRFYVLTNKQQPIYCTIKNHYSD